MHLKCFDYDLPENLIAQFPLKKRDAAKLLVVNRKTYKIIHEQFSRIEKYIPKSSSLVLNDSKVIHARIFGAKEKTGAKIEIFLLKRMPDGYSYEVLMRPMKRLKNEDKIILNKNLYATVMNREKRIVRFNQKNITDYLKRRGHIPLPPYIKRADQKEDKTYYQTVYAKNLGSVAAPTAGLHFTKPLLNKLKKAGHQISKVSLHINYGTFKPVEVSNIKNHIMHYEEYQIGKGTYSQLTKSKDKGRAIVAVGTTSTRVLESVAKSKNLDGQTNLFIYPGFKFRMVDHLLTNFHLPRSTLFMLVCAFGGTELVKKAYKEAIKMKYRFYSYGDAMLIL